MSYPGNPALGNDVQQRIVATFEQTLDLAIAGNRQEALLGCDFVLRMDSHFEPARRLQERIHAHPGALSHEALADLMPSTVNPASPANTAIDDDLGFLPHLDDFGGTGGLSGIDDLAGARGGLRDELEQLFAERRYADLVARAHQESAALAADPALGQLASAAQEKLESAPYVAKFLAAARSALASGMNAEVERNLDKARSLDPDHPEIGEIARSMSGNGAGVDEASFFTLESATPTSLPSLEPKAAAPPAQTFASESDRRIAQLLAEGDEAFDRGDPQAAIDSWSRIFLIDIDHDEAARRIERARRLKAESERQVEEIFHDGLSAGEAGDLAAARRAFERVLELQPTHLAAREQLQLLDAGQAPVFRPAPRSGEALDPLPSGFDSPAPADLKEEILVPPEGAAAQPRRERKEKVAATATPAPAPARAKRTFILVGAGVLVLVLAAGWLLFQNWDRWFPNSDSAAPAQASSADSIARARKLQEQGKTAIAIAQLIRIPPSDPMYAKARELIKEWEAPTAQPEPAGPAPEQAALRDQALAEAREAYTSRAYLLAAERFKEGADIAPLEGTDIELFEDAKRQLIPIAAQVQLFRDREWDMLLPQLWRLRESSPGPDIDRMLFESYYNLGVRDLQRMNPTKAVENFRDAGKLSRGDAELERNLQFAETYQAREPDLLYKIYVKYLRFR
jgi:tetratricopeptide (TPR) repeat protein